MNTENRNPDLLRTNAASQRSGRLSLGGTLVVTASGDLLFERKKLLGGALETYRHSRTSISLVCVRVAPPWMNTAIMLVPTNDRPLLVSFPAWKRAAVRHALHRAGMKIDEYKRWFRFWPPGRLIWRSGPSD